MTDGHKIIMKPEIPTMPWVMSEKPSNKEGNAQKSFRVKQKWFIQEHAARGKQGDARCIMIR